MEDLCTFVSSRGLLKSCTIHSQNPKSSCDSDIAHLENMDQRDNMSIYVCSDGLRRFVDDFLPKIHCAFYLVSGDSDLEVPSEVLSSEQFKTLVTNTNLIQWFAQNLSLRNFPKVKNLAIGLDYHTIGKEPDHWWRIQETEGYLPTDQESLLRSLARSAAPVHKRIMQIFSNVHWKLDSYGDRHEAIHTIPEHLLVQSPGHYRRSHTWIENCRYAFVLSPYGNGFDCHRTWEAVCLGAIPIVKAPHFDELFKGLPVLNVKEWSDVNEELLRKTIDEFKTRKFDYEKLNLAYWVDQFNPK